MKDSNCPEIKEFIKWVCTNCTDRLLFKVNTIQNIFDKNKKHWHSWCFNQNYFNHNNEYYLEYVKSDLFSVCSTKTLYEIWLEKQDSPNVKKIEYNQWMNDTFIPVNFLDYLVDNKFWLYRGTNDNGSGITIEYWTKGINARGKFSLEELYQKFLNR